MEIDLPLKKKIEKKILSAIYGNIISVQMIKFQDQTSLIL